MSERRLEIGPGQAPLAGFEAVDCVRRPGVASQAVWGEQPLPFADNTFTEVYASHVLEHVPWFLTHQALLEVRRILAPGGLFEVWTPDFAYIVQHYQRRQCGDGWRKHNPEGDPMKWAAGRLFTYGPGQENWHRACFDAAYLSQCLTRAEFVDIRRLKKRARGESHGPIDLGFTARKPA